MQGIRLKMKPFKKIEHALNYIKAKKDAVVKGEKLPEDYGVVSKTATLMPDSMKKRISNIGKG